jgi:hypothetical protein
MTHSIKILPTQETLAQKETRAITITVQFIQEDLEPTKLKL